jgi:glycosyltransferase involved in cell wall biosynthesis
VLDQQPPPKQILLVVDHNPDLASLARQEFPDVTVIESEAPAGLSGARNSGLRAANHPLTVFLDDDAEARPDWLAQLVDPYRNPTVVATGGSVHPRWPEHRPRWLPPEFDWVVGCSYQGLPEALGEIRNPIGANMSLRTGLALDVGGFNGAIGRIGTRPRGCEETELAIRLTASHPQSCVLYIPAAAVDHHVAKERLQFKYFLRRCWHEGQSKATVVRLVGSAGLERERHHAALVIPVAILREMRRFLRGEASALARAVAAAAGLSTAAAGYLAVRMIITGGVRRYVHPAAPR